VRQSRDYSCGLAALATVLTRLGSPVSEEELLEEIARGDTIHPEVSFSDLARLARERGFRALGVAIAPDLLPRLRGRPAIVALNVDGSAHFSVLRAAHADGAVWLADPSWGNRRLAGWEFERYFSANGERGRVLLIVPSSTGEAGASADTAGADGPGIETKRVGPGRSNRGGSSEAAEPPWRWAIHLLPGP
jgi:predicted double-glycine peptidase